MSDSAALFTGIVALFLGIFLAFVYMIGIGLPAEMIVDEFEAAGMYDVPADWSSYDDVNFMLSLIYMIVVLSCISGGILFILSSVKTMKQDTSLYPEQPYLTPEPLPMELQY